MASAVAVKAFPSFVMTCSPGFQHLCGFHVNPEPSSKQSMSVIFSRSSDLKEYLKRLPQEVTFCNIKRWSLTLLQTSSCHGQNDVAAPSWPPALYPPQLFIILSLLLDRYSSAVFPDVRTALLANQIDGTKNVGFSIVHRDAPRSPLRTAEVTTNALEPLDQNPLKHVIQHVQAQQVRINSVKSHHRHHHHHHHHHRRNKQHKKLASGIRSPVVTLGQAGLEYYMPIQIGTPPTEVILIMDTGSDVSWIQCVPCTDCAPALRPPFNPRHSSSFFKLPCTSTICKSIYQGVSPYCSSSGKTCLFSTRYADGSLSSGLLALETISTNTTTSTTVKVVNVTLGCANVDREGVPTGASGLLGMDRRPVSFPSQMSLRYGQKFSHCFPDKISHLNSSGVIFFGESEISPQLSYTPLLENKAVPTAALDYYYVGLVGISVNKIRLPLSDTNFEIQSTGSGGTIVDSGTAFTYLNRTADVFGFTPCYNVTNGDYGSTAVPTITLHFRGGLDVALPKNSILIPVRGNSRDTTFCLAFQTSSTIPFNVIGNYQQQDLWIEYDLKNLQLGVARLQCAAD